MVSLRSSSAVALLALAACAIDVQGTGPASDAGADALPPPPTDAGADAGGAPSLCRGLRLVLPFDGSLDGDQGEKPTSAPGTPDFEPAGKIGGAIRLGPDALTYPPEVYSRRQGTLSVWVRQTAAAITDCDHRIFATPIPGDTPGHRLMLKDDNGCKLRLTATVGNSAEALLTGPRADFQHVVGRWSLGQGGTRVVLRVDGAEASETRDIGSPTLSVTSIALNDERKMAGSALDDLGLWDRSLTNTEVTALEAAAKAGTPLSRLCPPGTR